MRTIRCANDQDLDLYFLAVQSICQKYNEYRSTIESAYKLDPIGWQAQLASILSQWHDEGMSPESAAEKLMGFIFSAIKELEKSKREEQERYWHDLLMNYDGPEH